MVGPRARGRRAGGTGGLKPQAATAGGGEGAPTRMEAGRAPARAAPHAIDHQYRILYIHPLSPIQRKILLYRCREGAAAGRSGLVTHRC